MKTNKEDDLKCRIDSGMKEELSRHAMRLNVRMSDIVRTAIAKEINKLNSGDKFSIEVLEVAAASVPSALKKLKQLKNP